MVRLKVVGWGLLFALVAVTLLSIDQLLLFSLGNSRYHFLYCRFRPNSSVCSGSAFRAHPTHFFLLDPRRSGFLAKLARSPEVPIHNDYALDDNGFRNVVPNEAAQRKVRINIFGDSFTFGLYLRESEHIGFILNAIPSKCVFRNYGVPAFDFRQMIGLSQDASLVGESELDLFLIISDDISGRLTRPFEVHRFGRDFNSHDLSRELGLKPVFPFRIPLFLVNNSFLFQKLAVVVDQWFWDSLDWESFHDKMLSRHWAADKRRLFLHIPVPSDYTRGPDGIWKFNLSKRLAEISLGDPVLKDESFFSALFFPVDGHPNPSGAKWIAARVMDKLNEICESH